ncbi:MAG: ribonuclease HII, partial [Megamonas funiformis]|uniref:ribonuclease HII n=1 Tax=Megamonas funiformis TaxID=437897 RepID=UPI001EB28025
SVILPENFFIEKINDSKKLSEATREKIYDIIMENAIAVNRAIIDEKTIDRVNIYQAAMNGMYEAIYGLNPKPDAVLIDAMPLESLDIYHQSIIKGDAKSASIAAASIVAKVERDRMMNEFDKIYPQYGFAKNKGYGTSEHLEALRKYGTCEIHRKSFEPITSMMMQK